ncbi:hypothetical protein JCM6882_007630 [Rhodosporidiobolus microsporus]
MQQDLADKVILLTGGTDGIGKAAALNFAKRGAHLTIVGRNASKTQAVVEELRTASGNPHLAFLVCDLSRPAEVKRAGEEFLRTHDRLDVLVNNAGAMFKAPFLTADGIEATFALNHLSYFQLTVTLLPLLRRTPAARVVSTSSAMQARGTLDLDSVATDLSRWGPNAYADSKLANVLFTKELQRRLDADGAVDVVANCFEPGMVRTQFGAMGSSDQGFFLNLVYCLAKPFALTPEQGADSLVWLATAPEAAQLKGEYVSKRKPARPQKKALDEGLAKRLWEMSEDLCTKATTAARVA